MAAEKNDTREVLAMNYVVSVKAEDGAVYTFSPSAAAVADTYRKSPRLIKRILEVEQEKQLKYPPADKFSCWKPEYVREKNIFKEFRRAVKKSEGSYVLVDTKVGDIFPYLKLLSDRAEGRVKSKKDDRIRGPYFVVIRGVFVGKNGRLDIQDEMCGCDYFSAKSLSGSADEKYRNECVHICLVRDEIDIRLRHPELRKDEFKKEGSIPHRPVAQPFPFSRNWNVCKINEALYYVAADYSGLASLENAILMHHFFDEMTYAETNKRALQDSRTYTPLLEEEKRMGNLRWRIIRKDTAEAEIPKSQASELNSLAGSTATGLNRCGFHHRGYSLVMGRHAERYERGPDVIEIVFSQELPPFYAHKRVGKIDSDIEILDAELRNPFLFDEPAWVDDFTKTRDTDINIGILSMLEIPGASTLKTLISDNLRNWYRRAVPEKHHQKFGLR